MSKPDIVSAGSQSFENGGMANLVGWIDQWRAANPETTLLLDAGDIWQGTYISNQSEGSVMVEAMNIAGYNAAAPGNHDFDFGQDVLIDAHQTGPVPIPGGQHRGDQHGQAAIMAETLCYL